MPKIRKQKRRQKFNYNANRKRLKKKLHKTPKITCEPIQKEWSKRETLLQNLKNMGLAYNSNIAVKMPRQISMIPEKVSETVVPQKIHVQEKLEEDANAPQERVFKLPNAQVEWVTYLMDTYGENYKAMARDQKNYYQETWKQLRAKVRKFKGVPEQYEEYLKSRKERGLGELEDVNMDES